MNKKVLRWNFVFQYGYVLTNIFNALILLPLYLKNIDSATLGMWLATGNVLAWMTLTDPGVGDVLQQKIAELRGRDQKLEVGKTIGAGIIASGFILLISIICGFIFFFSIDAIIGKDVSQYHNLDTALLLSIIATGLSLFSFSMSGINQGLHNAANVAIASLLANVVFLTVNLTFLYLGYGVISIAFANLCRAFFLNIYNIISMLKQLKRETVAIIYDMKFFKGFIKIFSFTSASRIIGGLSASADLIILARFIPAGMITVFEINKRPVQMTQSLIGRHSVALMPVISHSKGIGDKPSIISLINKQFKLYSYSALFLSLAFCVVHRDFITAWTNSEQYAGNTILYLLVANFFFGLIGYFMANVGYALGDIKRNSLVNIIKGIVYAILLFAVAGTYGITGALTVSLVVILFMDFFYFSFRLYRLGYLKTSLVKHLSFLWLKIVPLAVLAAWGCFALGKYLVPAKMHMYKVILSGGLFASLFIVAVLLIDKEIKTMFKDLVDKVSILFTSKDRIKVSEVNPTLGDIH